jgi:hypothetical protein
VVEFSALQAGVLAAAEAQGARLVSMENVYMYGPPAGCPLTETGDYAAHTKMGKLRGQMATELLAAHRAGRVAVAIGRASDYFGPRGGAQSNLGDRLFPPPWPENRHSPRRPRPAAHLHLHLRHRPRPRRSRRALECPWAGVASP